MTSTLLLEDGCGGVTAARVRPRDRITAHLHAHRIDVDLARGGSPDATVVRALRARTLTSMRSRRILARGLAHAAATSTAHTISVAPLNRRGVRQAAQEIEELRQLLLADGPVSVHGAAGAHLLLTDAAEPLYGRAEPDAVAAAVRRVISALQLHRG